MSPYFSIKREYCRTPVISVTFRNLLQISDLTLIKNKKPRQKIRPGALIVS